MIPSNAATFSFFTDLTAQSSLAGFAAYTFCSRWVVSVTPLNAAYFAAACVTIYKTESVVTDFFFNSPLFATLRDSSSLSPSKIERLMLSSLQLGVAIIIPTLFAAAQPTIGTTLLLAGSAAFMMLFCDFVKLTVANTLIEMRRKQLPHEIERLQAQLTELEEQQNELKRDYFSSTAAKINARDSMESLLPERDRHINLLLFKWSQSATLNDRNLEKQMIKLQAQITAESLNPSSDILEQKKRIQNLTRDKGSLENLKCLVLECRKRWNIYLHYQEQEKAKAASHLPFLVRRFEKLVQQQKLLFRELGWIRQQEQAENDRLVKEEKQKLDLLDQNQLPIQKSRLLVQLLEKNLSCTRMLWTVIERYDGRIVSI